MRSWSRRRGLLTASLLACVLTALLIAGAPAFAAGEGAGWELNGRTYPTNLTPSGKGTIVLDVFNVGAKASEGTVTVTDTLPAGFTAHEAGDLIAVQNGLSPLIGHGAWDCTGNGPGGVVEGATVVTCTNDPEGLAQIPGGGGPPADEDPNNQAPVAISVNVAASGSGLVNRATIAGGQAPTTASTSDPVTVSAQKPEFGFVGWDGWFSNADGTLDTQAGSHPYELTLSFDLANALQPNENLLPAGGEAKDIEVELPRGIVGDPTALPQCTRAQLVGATCPQASVIGVAMVSLAGGIPPEIGFPVFNMEAPPGSPAELAFDFSGILTFLDSNVRSGGDYGITTKVKNVAQRELMHSVVTLWGVPGEASHNIWRNGHTGGCEPNETTEGENYCRPPAFPILKPFFTLPTSCGTPGPLVIRANTWENESIKSEAKFQLHNSNDEPASITGCEKLAFGPQITNEPTSSEADSPTGLTVDVKPPLGGLQERGLLGSSDLQEATVTLPEGFVVNPGQAAGLQACQPSQAALTTEAERAAGTENNGPAACPAASKVGTVKVKTPLLEAAVEKEIEGSVYVLQSNPPDIKLLIAGSADGVNLKLVGDVHLDEQTGRLTTTFAGTPELPFSDFKLSFEGGSKAALDTPTQCGTYETDADFSPWAQPLISSFLTSTTLAISTGPGGGPCPSAPLPFAPTLTAGSTSSVAGGFSGFTQVIQRGDAQQRIEKFQFKEPAGMAGLISQVPLCREPQAAQGACPATSHIGHAVVQSGPGANPLTVPQPGAPEAGIYLTGPYHDAPFGLSIVTPIVAGPFNLGTIVTRAKIEVDPITAQITITTDPLPQIVDGVPTDLRSIAAVIDRPNFLFNPTNCSSQQFVGTATSAGSSATAPISSPFAVTGCQALKFAPKFTASTSSKTSKANGASLRVKISYPSGAQAHIAKVNLTIPSILPTRLTTIQKACPEAQFNANPAACPSASKIASAIVHTPIFNNPLEGPVYFVSHGNAAFPDVEMVLQGEGVTLIVDGKTQIKNGVTFSRFESVPDAPFSSFEFIAPQGPFSIFTANGNLCASEIKMPTTLTAQNGAVVTQSTHVEVQGCSNGLQVLSHAVKGRALKLRVVVPAAGKLTASGKGLVTTSKSSSGRSTLTLSVRAKKGGKFTAHARLAFKPKKGKKTAKSVKAQFRR
jgi:hypothetical protein